MAASRGAGAAGGGQPIVQRISLAGAEEVKRLLEGMGAQGEKAAAQIGRAMAASGGDTARLGAAVEASFGRFAGAPAAIKPARDAVEELHGGFRGIGGTLGNLTSVLLPNFTSKLGLGLAGLALGLKGVLGNAKSSITEIKNLSIETGLSINTIQSIKDVFEDQGVPVEKLSTVVGKFSEELGKARLEAQKLDGPLGSPFQKASEQVTTLRGGLEGAKAAANDTGIALHGAAQQVRDTSTAFGSLQMDAAVLKRFPDTIEGNFRALVEFSRRLNAVGDDTERARIGAQLFGRQWRTEAAGILAIAKNLESAMSERLAKGLTINPDDIARAAEYTKASHDLGDQLERVGQVIGVTLFPILTAMATRTEESVQYMRDTFAAFGNLVKAASEFMEREWGLRLNGMAAAANGLKGAVLDAFAGIIPGLGLVLRAIGIVQAALDRMNRTSSAPPAAPGFGPPVASAPLPPAEGGDFSSPRQADFGDFSPRPYDPTEVRPVEDVNPDFVIKNGLAGGGQVGGFGSGDIVPAWLTPKEFVVKVAAVRKYGVDFMRRLNSMQLPAFAMGGLVEALSPAPQMFASGGMVRAAAGGRGGTAIHLHLDGQTFPTMAADDVAEALTRVAVRRATLSAGRRPSYQT